MNKLHSIGLEKILLFCGFSLALTFAGFWEYQKNVTTSEKLAKVQNGVSTCFSRVTQSFTAAMIKDINSPYLKRDFMALTDECLKEGTKAAGIDVSILPKASQYFNDLISEVHWFHEKVVKVVGSAAAGAELPVQAINEKYVKVESLKMDLIDQLDLVYGQYKEARLRDEVLVTVAFMMFMTSLIIFGLKELVLLRHRRSVEHQALSLLNAGHARLAGMVDQLVQKALTGQGMPVASQVFSDYHTTVLENLSFRTADAVIPSDNEIRYEEEILEAQSEEVESIQNPEAKDESVDMRKLLTSQAIRLKASMEVQEGQVQADSEIIAQVIQAFGQRLSFSKLNLVGSRENENYLIKLQADDICFNAYELNYISTPDSSMSGVDVNIVIGMDLIRDYLLQAEIGNRKASDGAIIGAEILLRLPLVQTRSLVNVVRGKKKELARQLSPAEFN
jgi:hypothetical protein